MSAQEDTQRLVGTALHVEGDDGKLIPLALNPVNIGGRKKIWLMCYYSNGSSAPAVDVTWVFPANVYFVSDFNPTTQQAIPVPPPTAGNPVSVVPWFLTAGFQPGVTTAATITATGEDPVIGGSASATDDLGVITPNITCAGEPAGGDGIDCADDQLRYATQVGFGLDLVISGVPAGDQIAFVQLADTFRAYAFEDNSQDVLYTSNGQFWCDYLPSTQTFFCDAEVSTGAPIQTDFYDLPLQPLQSTYNGKPVATCWVQDDFLTYIIYRSSSLPPEQYDPNNLWTPIQLTNWGWWAQALEDEGDFVLDKDNSGYVDAATGAAVVPLQWTGSIPDNLLGTRKRGQRGGRKT